MKYTPVPKLIKEEIKGEDLDAFIERFVPGYNNLLDQQASLWPNITTSDNLKCKVYDFNNVTGSAMASKVVAWSLDQAPVELTLARLQEVSGTALTAAPWLTWTYSKGQITFQLKGLVSASNYNVRLKAQV